jgi:tetraacyldisaccharide 4'-kinase
MTSEAPVFWWQKPDWRALLLSPFAAIYGAVAEQRLLKTNSPAIDAPVICVGNLTVGGGGKTPTVVALLNHAQKLGLKPGIVTRGYGGHEKGPHLVDHENDTARHVGDEPLLLSYYAPVAVGKNRFAAAKLLRGKGCNFIIMDDGFQSARLHADCNLIVVDSRRGIGNGHVIPAGPLRAPLTGQMRKTDALLVIGKGDEAEWVIRAAARAGKPVFEASFKWEEAAMVRGKRFLAFAGIADPDKFFDSLQESGAWVSLSRVFPDHYHYTDEDMAELMQTAEKGDLTLVTTEKDAVRFVRGSETAQKMADRTMVFQIELGFEESTSASQIIQGTIDQFRLRTQSAL